MSLVTLLNGYLDKTDEKIKDYIEEHDHQEVTKTVNQSDILIHIHNEFSLSFVKQLYYKSEWTDRIFWAIVGTIQLRFEDITLEQTIMYITRYLRDNKMIVPYIKQ